MAEGKRKPGRPRKHVGLAPPDLKRIVNERVLRDLRTSESVEERPVLHPASATETAGNEAGGIFGPVVVPATLPAPATEAQESELSFTDYLKQVVREIAPAEFQMPGENKTGLELLARAVLRDSLENNMRSQRARELLIERLEGKAQRANPVVTPDTMIEDQLDAAALALLNDMTEPKEPPQ